MIRVVEPVVRGRYAGMFIAKVEIWGKTFSVGSFKHEHEAEDFLLSQSDSMIQEFIKMTGRIGRFSDESWFRQAAAQVTDFSFKYIFMKNNLSAEQANAIRKYAEDNNAVPQLSSFPKVTFKIKDSDEYREVSLMVLVDAYKRSKEEERKSKVAEKRRMENENKWKPTSGRFSS